MMPLTKQTTTNFFLTAIFCLSITCGQAQKNNASKINRDSSPAISLADFDRLVDASILLLQTKNLDAISDSGHIYIMMCHNTFLMASDKNFQRKFKGGRYEKLETVSYEKKYYEGIIKVYPKWVPNLGMGFYFPKLNMELGGTPSPRAYFHVMN